MKERKWKIIKYAIILLSVLFLYSSGYHVEVLGLVQRGLLKTGLLQPKLNNTATADMAEVNAPSYGDEIKFLDDKGNFYRLSDFKGSVVFMNIWATWCPPCIAEMPSIHDLKKELGEGYQFIMVSRDKDFTLAPKFMERKEYDLPVYQLAGNLPPELRTPSIPTTYIFNGQGELVYQHTGMANYNSPEIIEFLTNIRNP